MKRCAEKLVNVNSYSIDMVRLRIRVFVDDVLKFFNDFCCNSDVEYWESSRIKEFRHNWVFSANDKVFQCCSSFWVGYQHNMEAKGTKHWLTIEYNPNKNDMCTGYLNQILKHFYKVYDDVQVQSVDIACDMPVSMSNIFCDKGGKKVKKVFDYGSNNKTIYLGEGSGRIKIYNKANELKENGVELDYELTRYEITIKFDNTGAIPNTIKRYNNIDEKLMSSMIVPIYCIESYQYDMHIGDTDRAILYAVLSGYPIELLSRRKRGVVQEILSKSSGNVLEGIGFANAYSTYFKEYMSVI